VVLAERKSAQTIQKNTTTPVRNVAEKPSVLYILENGRISASIVKMFQEDVRNTVR
jgi:hypothetical protein